MRLLKGAVQCEAAASESAKQDRVHEPDDMANIGPIELSVPFCQAGLAGYSDRAMRVVARRRGCPYAVTEALLDVILLNGGHGLRRSIDINDEDHPDRRPDYRKRASTRWRRPRGSLAQAGYDVIDLNFACPVKKIKNKARGGHMLLDANRAVSVLKAVRDALPPGLPTTISLRRGFDDSAESEDRFYHIVDSAWVAGYCGNTCPRTDCGTKVSGRGAMVVPRERKTAYPGKTILGSGDLFTAEDAIRMLRRDRRGHRLDRPRRDRQPLDLPPGRFAAGAASMRALPMAPPTISEQRIALCRAFRDRDADPRRAARRPADAAKWASSTADFIPTSRTVKQRFHCGSKPARLDGGARRLVLLRWPRRLARRTTRPTRSTMPTSWR